MGDRGNLGIKTSNNETIFIYLHWGGADRHEDVARAISYAMAREHDESYFTRIFISRVIGDSWDKETGVGMSINQISAMGDGYDVPVYDYIDKTISVYQEDWNSPSGIANEPDKVYDRDEYLAKYAIRGVGQYV